MTDTKPGGVAGQVTEFIGTRINNGHEHVAALGGALAMHNALSREARVMIAEFSDNASVEDEIYIQGLEALSRRLGLDMESEDE